MNSGQSTGGVTVSGAQKAYELVVGWPVEHWYLDPIRDQMAGLTEARRLAIRRQAQIGWLQTVLLVVAVLQSLFAGVLAALPPDWRASLSFLHRIEWGVYLAIILVAAQVFLSWQSGVLLTNRFYLLAWRIGSPRIAQGSPARRAQIAYIALIALMIVAAFYVRANGFIVQAGR